MTSPQVPLTAQCDQQVRHLMQIAHKWAGPDEADQRSDILETALRAALLDHLAARPQEQEAKYVARYRWLRDMSPADKAWAPTPTLCNGHGIKVCWQGPGDGKHLPWLFLDGKNLDAAIDSAIAAQAAQPKDGVARIREMTLKHGHCAGCGALWPQHHFGCTQKSKDAA